jgi:hypothetical protein
MSKCIFSVGPIPGFKSVPYLGSKKFRNVSQSEPARDSQQPNRPLVNVRVIAEHDSFWGPGKDYVSPVLNNPTWRQMKHIAEKAMKVTGDHHHQFLEAIHFTGKFHSDGSEYVELWMGS